MPQDNNQTPPSDSRPPEIEYRQPGSFDHGVKNYFKLHHLVGYALLGMILLAVVAVAYWYQVSQKIAPSADTLAPVIHHEKENPSKIVSVNSSLNKYVNTKYDYSFEYPKDWFLTPCDDETVLVFARCASEGVPTFSVYVIPNMTLTDFYSRNNNIGTKENTVFAGISADEYEFVAEGSEGPGPIKGTRLKNIVFQKDSNIFDIGFAQEPTQNFEQEFSHIISTFKFTDEAGNDHISCAQVITTALNQTTGEVRDFPTPCDVSEGWIKFYGFPDSGPYPAQIDPCDHLVATNPKTGKDYRFADESDLPSGWSGNPVVCLNQAPTQ